MTYLAPEYYYKKVMDLLTSNALAEFSESLREMGGCLLEKAELYKDDESSM